MIKSEYKVIGVMSGTSLDGIDLVYVTFNFNQVWQFKILYAETVSYTEDWIGVLQNLINFKKRELELLDKNYTTYISTLISDFIIKHDINDIDAVCSHGHTALHRPEKGLTYQIGNLPKMAKLINRTVVCDFRVQDVALGGQGAPLVPIGDRLLFSQYDYCLNLGGFANVSTEKNKNRIAYDICAVNIVLNHYTRQLGLDYDEEGKIALSGKVNDELLKALNALKFYQQDHPKSLGFEWVKDSIFPLINSFTLNIKDNLRTFVEHIAFQISKEINTKENARVLITGGGVFNSFLISKIQSGTNNKIIIPPKNIIEYKEALIFGLLGVLKLRNEVNCLSSVTGAKRDHCTGKIFHP